MKLKLLKQSVCTLVETLTPTLSHRERERKCAFTLAETMIVIVVLGIIATLTIPALVNKNKESVAKTKVRKAMAAYESALNKMIIEYDLKSDDTLAAWAGDAENNCANSSNYFKKVQGDGCIFKTSDGIWWDISNIERPLIAFKDTDLTQDKANSTTDMSAFVLVGRFGTDGSLRVDDLAYETNHDEDNSKAQVAKLYNLLNGKKSSGSEETSEYTFASQRQKYLDGDFSTPCQETFIACTEDYYGDFVVYDDKGNYFTSGYCSSDNNCYIYDNTYYFADNTYVCADNLPCSSSRIRDKRDNVNIVWSCDGTGSNCAGISSIEFKVDDSGSTGVELWNCNIDGSICDLGISMGCSHGHGNCYNYATVKTDEATGKKYWSIKEQYRPTRNSNLTYSE